MDVGLLIYVLYFGESILIQKVERLALEIFLGKNFSKHLVRNLTKLINFMGYFMDSSVLNNMGGGSLIYLPYPPPDKNNELHSRVHC